MRQNDRAAYSRPVCMRSRSPLGFVLCSHFKSSSRTNLGVAAALPDHADARIIGQQILDLCVPVPRIETNEASRLGAGTSNIWKLGLSEKRTRGKVWVFRFGIEDNGLLRMIRYHCTPRHREHGCIFRNHGVLRHRIIRNQLRTARGYENIPDRHHRPSIGRFSPGVLGLRDVETCEANVKDQPSVWVEDRIQGVDDVPEVCLGHAIAAQGFGGHDVLALGDGNVVMEDGQCVAVCTWHG